MDFEDRASAPGPRDRAGSSSFGRRPRPDWRPRGSASGPTERARASPPGEAREDTPGTGPQGVGFSRLPNSPAAARRLPLPPSGEPTCRLPTGGESRGPPSWRTSGRRDLVLRGGRSTSQWIRRPSPRRRSRRRRRQDRVRPGPAPSPAALPGPRKRDPPTSPAERLERISAKPSGFGRAPRPPAPREPAPRREQRRPLRGSTEALGFGRGADGGEHALSRKHGWSSSSRLAPVNPAADSRSPVPGPSGPEPGKHRTAPSPWTAPLPVRRSGSEPGDPKRVRPQRACPRAGEAESRVGKAPRSRNDPVSSAPPSFGRLPRSPRAAH